MKDDFSGQLSDREATRRGVSTLRYRKRARNRYAEKHWGTGAKWGGRRYNKQANPIPGDKSYGARKEHAERFKTERDFGLTRGK